MEVICDYCKNTFDFKGGQSHYNRIKADATANELELVLKDLRRIENERI